MAELAAEPQRGKPAALPPVFRQQGWFIHQQSSTGKWFYVHRSPDGQMRSQWERPGSRGWPAARLLGRDQADELYKEAVAVAVARCAKDTAGQTCYICYGEGDEEGLVRGCACRGESGIAHISCLAEQARRLVEQAERRNLRGSESDKRWARWHTCGVCEAKYHGVVLHALGWACWKTYVGRPETDENRIGAMTQLGNGLYAAGHDEDAASVFEAVLSIRRRLGAPEQRMNFVQGNLACTYSHLGRDEQALNMYREVYFRDSKLFGEEHADTMLSAGNYAYTLLKAERFEEAKALMRKMMPVARRVLRENDRLTLKMRWDYAEALYTDPGATLEDVREAATTLEELELTARRVLGPAHPNVGGIERCLRDARATLRAREFFTPPKPRDAASPLAPYPADPLAGVGAGDLDEEDDFLDDDGYGDPPAPPQPAPQSPNTRVTAFRTARQVADGDDLTISLPPWGDDGPVDVPVQISTITLTKRMDPFYQKRDTAQVTATKKRQRCDTSDGERSLPRVSALYDADDIE